MEYVVKKTAEEWLKLPEYRHLIVLDYCPRWSYGNNFLEEQITEGEFYKNLLTCTLKILDNT